MTVSLKGYDEKTATFKISGGVRPGQPVEMADNLTVKPCASGSDIIGVCVNVRGDYACVQLTGYTVLPYSGASAPAVGFTALSADGAGGVAAADSGRSFLVTDIDTAKNTVGLIL